MSVLRISAFSPHAESSRMIFTARSVTIMRDRVDSREGVYKRRRLSCHLEWTNSKPRVIDSASSSALYRSHCYLRRLSHSLLVFFSVPTGSLFYLHHRVRLLFAYLCPLLSSPRFSRIYISFRGFALTLSLSFIICASATIVARFSALWRFLNSKFMKCQS